MKIPLRLLGLLAAVGLAVVALVGPPVDTAEAHPIPYGWWRCTQGNRLANAPVYVGVTTGAYAFPATGYGDGVANSWSDRIGDSASHLDNIVLNHVGKPYGVGYVGTATPVSVELQYKPTPSNLYLGWTEVGELCWSVHATRTIAASPISIQIQPLSYWFTQDNSRRALWESCTSEASSYTCSKTYDAGGVIVHELLHAMGLAHPDRVDVHTSYSTDAVALAKCYDAGPPLITGFDGATMCPALKWRSNGRTMEAWDKTSLLYAIG